jgi:hypothetical protein
MIVPCCVASVDSMHDIEVEYVTFPGWRGKSTSECRTFNALPHNARLYVQFIEQFLGVPGLCSYKQLFVINIRCSSEMDWCWKGSYGHDSCVLKFVSVLLEWQIFHTYLFFQPMNNKHLAATASSSSMIFCRVEF